MICNLIRVDSEHFTKDAFVHKINFFSILSDLSIEHYF